MTQITPFRPIDYITTQEELDEYVRIAVLEERERCHQELVEATIECIERERDECAKTADLVAREIDDTNGTATYIAAAIRARGDA